MKKRGGRGLFHHYSSLGKALEAIYPQHPWQLSRFIEVKAPYGFWKNKGHLMNALADAEQKLGIQQVTFV